MKKVYSHALFLAFQEENDRWEYAQSQEVRLLRRLSAMPQERLVLVAFIIMKHTMRTHTKDLSMKKESNSCLPILQGL